MGERPSRFLLLMVAPAGGVETPGQSLSLLLGDPVARRFHAAVICARWSSRVLMAFA